MRKAVGSHKWAHRGCMKQLEKDGRLCRDKQCRIWSGVVYAVYREELPKWNAPKNTSGFYNIMSLEFTLKKVPNMHTQEVQPQKSAQGLTQKRCTWIWHPTCVMQGCVVLHLAEQNPGLTITKWIVFLLVQMHLITSNCVFGFGFEWPSSTSVSC